MTGRTSPAPRPDLDALIHEALDAGADEFTPTRSRAATRAHVTAAAARHRRRARAMTTAGAFTAVAAAFVAVGVVSNGPAREAVVTRVVTTTPAVSAAAPTSPPMRLGPSDHGETRTAVAGSTIVVRLADTAALTWAHASSGNPEVVRVVSVVHGSAGLTATFHVVGLGSALLTASATSTCAPGNTAACTELPTWSVRLVVAGGGGAGAVRAG